MLIKGDAQKSVDFMLVVVREVVLIDIDDCVIVVNQLEDFLVVFVFVEEEKAKVLIKNVMGQINSNCFLTPDDFRVQVGVVDNELMRNELVFFKRQDVNDANSIYDCIKEEVRNNQRKSSLISKRRKRLWSSYHGRYILRTRPYTSISGRFYGNFGAYQRKLPCMNGPHDNLWRRCFLPTLFFAS